MKDLREAFPFLLSKAEHLLTDDELAGLSRLADHADATLEAMRAAMMGGRALALHTEDGTSPEDVAALLLHFDAHLDAVSATIAVASNAGFALRERLRVPPQVD